MTLLLSGEGPTDIGREVWDHNQMRFQPGPMARIVDVLCPGNVQFVHKDALQEDRESSPMRLPGLRNPAGAGYHYKSALLLGRKAVEEQKNGQVVAVLFRDADGTRTTPRDDWERKFQSILEGFAAARFSCGVPMVPRPKSEAWMLCGLKDAPYQGCERLEECSGNDASPKSLKKMLADRLGGAGTTEEQAEAVRDGRVDPQRIDMPSFNCFRERLWEVVAGLAGGADGVEGVVGAEVEAPGGHGGGSVNG